MIRDVFNGPWSIPDDDDFQAESRFHRDTMKRKIYLKLHNALCAAFGHILWVDASGGGIECHCGKRYDERY